MFGSLVGCWGHKNVEDVVQHSNMKLSVTDCWLVVIARCLDTLAILMIFTHRFTMFYLSQSKLELREQGWVLHSVDFKLVVLLQESDFTDSFGFCVNNPVSCGKRTSSQALEKANEY